MTPQVSPAMLAFSAAVTLVAVFLGAILAAWARRDVADRNVRTNVAISLFNEFHAPQFIRYRHAAFAVLQAENANGFVAAFASCAQEQEDAITTLVHFFEKAALLWDQRKVDRHLVVGFLGSYVESYGEIFFAKDQSDESDAMWGDLARRLKAFVRAVQAHRGA